MRKQKSTEVKWLSQGYIQQETVDSGFKPRSVPPKPMLSPWSLTQPPDRGVGPTRLLLTWGRSEKSRFFRPLPPENPANPMGTDNRTKKAKSKTRHLTKTVCKQLGSHGVSLKKVISCLEQWEIRCNLFWFFPNLGHALATNLKTCQHPSVSRIC